MIELNPRAATFSPESGRPPSEARLHLPTPNQKLQPFQKHLFPSEVTVTTGKELRHLDGQYNLGKNADERGNPLWLSKKVKGAAPWRLRFDPEQSAWIIARVADGLVAYASAPVTVDSTGRALQLPHLRGLRWNSPGDARAAEPLELTVGYAEDEMRRICEREPGCDIEVTHDLMVLSNPRHNSSAKIRKVKIGHYVTKVNDTAVRTLCDLKERSGFAEAEKCPKAREALNLKLECLRSRNTCPITKSELVRHKSSQSHELTLQCQVVGVFGWGSGIAHCGDLRSCPVGYRLSKGDRHVGYISPKFSKGDGKALRSGEGGTLVYIAPGRQPLRIWPQERFAEAVAREVLKGKRHKGDSSHPPKVPVSFTLKANPASCSGKTSSPPYLPLHHAYDLRYEPLAAGYSELTDWAPWPPEGLTALNESPRKDRPGELPSLSPRNSLSTRTSGSDTDEKTRSPQRPGFGRVASLRPSDSLSSDGKPPFAPIAEATEESSSKTNGAADEPLAAVPCPALRRARTISRSQEPDRPYLPDPDFQEQPERDETIARLRGELQKHELLLDERQRNIRTLTEDRDSVRYKLEAAEGKLAAVDSMRAAKQNHVLDGQAWLNGKLTRELTELQGALQRRDAEGRRKGHEIQDKVEEIRRKDEDLGRKDGEVRRKDSELVRKDNELQSKDAEIRRLQARLRERDDLRVRSQEDSSKYLTENGLLRRQLQQKEADLDLRSRENQRLCREQEDFEYVKLDNLNKSGEIAKNENELSRLKDLAVAAQLENKRLGELIKRLQTEKQLQLLELRARDAAGAGADLSESPLKRSMSEPIPMMRPQAVWEEKGPMPCSNSMASMSVSAEEAPLTPKRRSTGPGSGLPLVTAHQRYRVAAGSRDRSPSAESPSYRPTAATPEPDRRGPSMG